jgi:hypothetical protein
MLRNRCWPTTFHTTTVGDVDGWCHNWSVWSTPHGALHFSISMTASTDRQFIGKFTLQHWSMITIHREGEGIFFFFLFSFGCGGLLVVSSNDLRKKFPIHKEEEPRLSLQPNHGLVDGFHTPFACNLRLVAHHEVSDPLGSRYYPKTQLRCPHPWVRNIECAFSWIIVIITFKVVLKNNNNNMM